MLHDPDGALAGLLRFAGEVLDSYKTPERDLRDVRYWQYASQVNIRFTLDAGDDLQARFLSSTTAWSALEGVWAVSDLRMPHRGVVLMFLGALDVSTLGSPPLL